MLHAVSISIQCLIIIQRSPCTCCTRAPVQFRQRVMVSNHFATSNTFKLLLTCAQVCALLRATAPVSVYSGCAIGSDVCLCVCVCGV